MDSMHCFCGAELSDEFKYVVSHDTVDGIQIPKLDKYFTRCFASSDHHNFRRVTSSPEFLQLLIMDQLKNQALISQIDNSDSLSQFNSTKPEDKMSSAAEQHCIKCKKPTPNKEDSSVTGFGKRGHPLITTVCDICGAKKNRFLKHDPANPPTITPRPVLAADATPKSPKTPKVKKSRSTKKDKAQDPLNVAGVAASAVDAA